MSDLMPQQSSAGVGGSSRAARFKDALLQGPAAGGEGWTIAPPAPAAPAPGPVVPGRVRPRPAPVEPQGHVGGLAVPYGQVVELRQRVAERLAQESAEQPGLGVADRQRLGQSLVRRVVAEWATAYAATSAKPLTAADEEAVRKAVFAELFQAGRLQPFLDDAEVENIIVSGVNAMVDYRSRPAQDVGRIAESDADVIELINQLVRTQGQGERALTPASPLLNTRLADGSRLAAAAFVTPSPEIVIRRHRTRNQGLTDLQQWGTIDSTLAAFLKAAVLAGKNIVVAGSQGVGKTSLLRALAREIPSSERVVTLEGEYELWLHTDPEGPTVVAMEAREGNGERGPDGRASGEISLSDLFVHSLRMSARRVIVGEVRGTEVLPMLHAMGEGAGGSMCTLHARSAEMAIERLVLLAMQDEGTQMTEPLAYRLIAEAIDFIVYVSLIDETAIGGQRHRFVSQVMEVTGVGEGGRPSRQHVFGPREDSGRREVRAVPLMAPQCLPELERVGFDRRLLQQPWGTWERPLQVVVGA